MSEVVLNLRGKLIGHNGWVTSIATSLEDPNVILSSSRDNTVIIWELTRVEPEFGHAHRALHGHGHHVEDVVISTDGQFALSASWDASLRLWDLKTGKTTRRFIGHTKDVLSVAFSADNRQIVSGSRDHSIRLWNTLGICKYVIDDAHSDWVSCVCFAPNINSPSIVSAGWDKVVKVWALKDCSLMATLSGHTGYINSVTVSPDGSLCASGGKDGNVILWDLNIFKELHSFETNSVINVLCFSHNYYWLCVGTDNGIKIFDLENKVLLTDITKDFPGFEPKNRKAACISLNWSADGNTLYAGYTDSIIRVWSIPSNI